MDSNLVSLTLAVLIIGPEGAPSPVSEAHHQRFRPIASASPSFASNDIPIEAEPRQIFAQTIGVVRR